MVPYSAAAVVVVVVAAAAVVVAAAVELVMKLVAGDGCVSPH